MSDDIRDARFYVVRDDDGKADGSAEPLDFDMAYEKAIRLVESGVGVSVLYTEEASQMEITRFVSHGIPASLVSGA